MKEEKLRKRKPRMLPILAVYSLSKSKNVVSDMTADFRSILRCHIPDQSAGHAIFI